MSSLIGHAIVSTALAKTLGLNNRETAASIVLSVLPDADVIAGFIGRGNGEAWHHAQWSHSPRAATAAGCLVAGGSIVLQAGSPGVSRYVVALRAGAIAGAMVGSHYVMDKWLRNPLERRRKVHFSRPHHLPGVVRYHVTNLPNDLVFYGSLSLAFYRTLRRFFR